MKKVFKAEDFKRRMAMCILGVVVSGISVGFFKRAAFGIDPFQSFMTGINTVSPLSFGTTYVIVNVAMLIFSLIADRHYIGIATLINIFFLGYIIDFSTGTLYRLFPDLGMPGRVLFFAIGIVVLCIASSLYFTADLGVSVYDAVALIIVNTWHKGQFRWVRILTDLACVGFGACILLLSGSTLKELFSVVGIGTIVTALFMGPLIDLFNRKLARPILKKELRQKSTHSDRPRQRSVWYRLEK